MRVNRNISAKERRRYALDNLGGVDFSSSPLLCAPNRSPDAKNWIGDHGINRKRHGWEQVIDTFKGKPINGIFPITDKYLLMQVDGRFYTVTYKDDAYTAVDTNNAAGTGKVRSSAFRSGDILYIVGDGNIRTFKVEKEVSKSNFVQLDPYIPTTTINIGHDGKENDVRSVLGAPNLLTQWRKNTLEGTQGTANSRWSLDAKIVKDSKVTVKASVIYEKDDNSYEIKEREYYTKEDSEKSYLYVMDGDTESAVGFVDYENGKISLSEPTPPPVDGQANITVTFKADVEGKSGYINNCTFGTLFGVGGAQDRLFLSGNASFPNVVFFSEANDFTYFPDTYTATFGTSGTPVKGFLRLSDSVLAVLKEDGVYYQSGEYRTEYDDAGNIKKITPVFSITAGSINEGAVNPYAVANFGGDNVFLSRNGVFGIEPTSNVLTNTRTARERSYPIAARMPKFDAANAVMFTHGQRLYLSDGDACYVADSAHKYTPTGSESYSYEWWYWDHIPARVFAEVNGELWFGTEDGRVCRFTDGYTDVTYDDTLDGEIGYIDDEAVTYDEKDKVGEILDGHRVRFITDGWKDEAGDLKGVDLYAHLIKPVEGEDAEMYLRFARYSDANESELITFASNGTNPRLRVYTDTPVVAEWLSPPLDLGNDSIAKTLYSLTVTAETGKNSVLAFGYETRKRSEEMMASGLGVFSFEDMDFRSFSFENGFQTSYTVRARDRNFNFIRFCLRSDGDRACAVHRISAIYKLNKHTKGVV